MLLGPFGAGRQPHLQPVCTAAEFCFFAFSRSCPTSLYLCVISVTSMTQSCLLLCRWVASDRLEDRYVVCEHGAGDDGGGGR